MDKVNQVGQIVRQTKDETDHRLRRFRHNWPIVERVSDYFNDQYPFKMEFKTTPSSKNVLANFYFGEGVVAQSTPTPGNCPGCCPDCFPFPNCPPAPEDMTVFFADNYNRTPGQPPNGGGTYFVMVPFNGTTPVPTVPTWGTENGKTTYITNMRLILDGPMGKPWSMLLATTGLPNVTVTPPILTTYQSTLGFQTNSGVRNVVFTWNKESHFFDPNPGITSNTNLDPQVTTLTQRIPVDWSIWVDKDIYVRYNCDGSGFGVKVWLQSEAEPAFYTAYISGDDEGTIPIFPADGYTQYVPLYPNLVQVQLNNTGTVKYRAISLGGNPATGDVSSVGIITGRGTDHVSYLAGWDVSWCNEYTLGIPVVFFFCGGDGVFGGGGSPVPVTTLSPNGGGSFPSPPSAAVGWEYATTFGNVIDPPGQVESVTLSSRAYGMIPSIGPEPRSITIRGSLALSGRTSTRAGAQVPLTVEMLAGSWAPYVAGTTPIPPYAFKYSFLGRGLGSYLLRGDQWTSFEITATQEMWRGNNGIFEWFVRFQDADAIPAKFGYLPQEGFLFSPDTHTVGIKWANISVSVSYDQTSVGVYGNGFCLPDPNGIPAGTFIPGGVDSFACLAQLAGNRLVGGSASPSVIKGILAQWYCENGSSFPPPRNNPGNNAEGWASGLTYPYTIETPNPQPGNPIVTYDTLMDGALAYADGLLAFDRYSVAVQKARNGDGLGMAEAICDAGYGTSKTCVDNVYESLTDVVCLATTPTGDWTGSSISEVN
jgi:hypothetical protein